ncbi:LysR substrate-binding domain-containing protein [Kocuria sp. U4B]|nr:LysR substrate-binding domain-containing protein [Kocuria rosea]
MDLTIHHLRCFLAVAEELHFGRAAARLHLSPSSLSEQVSALERRLSRRLFRRSSRRVELTADGRELIPRARAAVAAMEDVVGWAEAVAGGQRLRIGLMVSSPGFRTIMAAAARRMPQVQWEIRQLGFLGCHGALARGEVDCAFVAEIGEAPAQQFPALRLWEEGCVLVVPEQHRFAGRGSVRLAELAGETFVSVEDGAVAGRWFPALASADGAAPRLLPVARSFEEVLELCGAGLGVNIAGESAQASYARPGVRFVRVEDAPPATSYLYLRPGPRPGPLEEFARLAAELAHP